ncbi:MAG TPA: Rrf2 family transcriptional regulator [Solirubrobacteraceae bacterium]
MTGPTNTQFTVGLHALTLLSHLGGPLSSEFIAASAGANPVYVRRVLGRLRDAGYVASRPGVRGGWQLLRDPADLTLGDVWRVIAGDQPALLGVHHADPNCDAGQDIQATLEAVERRAARAVEAELDAIAIADLTPDLAASLRRRLGAA